MPVKVSVIMAIYNPAWDKCLLTLDSILGQESIDLELIITDDGSDSNLFDRFELYFQQHGFNNYHLIGHKANQGTVKNYYDGLINASGEYVKLISPGDALFNETTLYEWSKFLSESGKLWSFGNSVFYSNKIDSRLIVKQPAFPMMIDCYYSHDDDACRWNYVVLEDYASGAALLCDRLLMHDYLSRFINIMKYTEDIIHVAMMYDGITPAFFDRNVIFYEFGEGVSTSNDSWIRRIRTDQRNAEISIASKNPCDNLQKKMNKSLLEINKENCLSKGLKKCLQKGGVKKVLKYRLNPRLSSSDISSCGKWWSVS